MHLHAKSYIWIFMHFLWYPLCTLKKEGPRTEPCGTSDKTSQGDKKDLSTTTFWVWSFKITITEENPYAIKSDFCSNLTCVTLIKCLDKSSIPTSICNLSFKALAKLSYSFDWQEYFALKPNWQCRKMSCNYRCFIIWLESMCFIILQTIDVNDTG